MGKTDEKLNMEATPDLCGQRGCFAYKDGHCDCLRDTDFGGRGCPFFKTMKQYEADLKRTAADRQTAGKADDFLTENAGLMEELAAMEAEAERIAREGESIPDPASDDDGWDDADDEGGGGDADE